MAERKSTNKYYPPEWEPSMGGLNKFHGTHHLRERARKLKSEGMLVVRFEMPYNVWCTHCNQHIGKGVRYNAQKKRVGAYLSSPIYQFRMKCHLCDGWMEIHTDPQNHDFAFVEGVRRVAETPSESAEERGVLGMTDDKEREAMLDPMHRLEHVRDDETRAEKRTSSLQALLDMREARAADEYDLNAQLRRDNRVKRVKTRVLDERRRVAPTVLEAAGILDDPDAPPRPDDTPAREDRAEAASMRFQRGPTFAEHKRNARAAIAAQSIFAPTGATERTPAPSPAAHARALVAGTPPATPPIRAERAAVHMPHRAGDDARATLDRLVHGRQQRNSAAASLLFRHVQQQVKARRDAGPTAPFGAPSHVAARPPPPS